MITTIMEFKESLRDIVVTIPKSVKWEDYEQELIAAENGEILNFKVNGMPRTGVGNRCYICYNGNVIGYHIISGLSNKSFDCTTTGRGWSGNFMERTGKFFRIEPVPMKGFQGFRYY
jgi:hypothetical protein